MKGSGGGGGVKLTPLPEKATIEIPSLIRVNVDNIVISKLIETNTNSKCFIVIKFDKVIKPLVLIMPKMSGYVKTFKVKDGDKHKNNKLMSFCIDDEKLLEKYKAKNIFKY